MEQNSLLEFLCVRVLGEERGGGGVGGGGAYQDESSS